MAARAPIIKPSSKREVRNQKHLTPKQPRSRRRRRLQLPKRRRRTEMSGMINITYITFHYILVPD